MEIIIDQLSQDFGAFSLGVVFVALMTQLLKKKFTSVDPRYFSVGLSLVAGLVYASVQTYVPIELVEKLSSFGSLVFASATGIYKLQK